MCVFGWHSSVMPTKVDSNSRLLFACVVICATLTFVECSDAAGDRTLRTAREGTALKHNTWRLLHNPSMSSRHPPPSSGFLPAQPESGFPPVVDTYAPNKRQRSGVNELSVTDYHSNPVKFTQSGFNGHQSLMDSRPRYRIFRVQGDHSTGGLKSTSSSSSLRGQTSDGQQSQNSHYLSHVHPPKKSEGESDGSVRIQTGRALDRQHTVPNTLSNVIRSESLPGVVIPKMSRLWEEVTTVTSSRQRPSFSSSRKLSGDHEFNDQVNGPKIGFFQEDTERRPERGYIPPNMARKPSKDLHFSSGIQYSNYFISSNHKEENENVAPQTFATSGRLQSVKSGVIQDDKTASVAPSISQSLVSPGIESSPSPEQHASITQFSQGAHQGGGIAKKITLKKMQSFLFQGSELSTANSKPGNEVKDDGVKTLSGSSAVFPTRRKTFVPKAHNRHASAHGPLQLSNRDAQRTQYTENDSNHFSHNASKAEYGGGTYSTVTDIYPSRSLSGYHSTPLPLGPTSKMGKAMETLNPTHLGHVQASPSLGSEKSVPRSQASSIQRTEAVSSKKPGRYQKRIYGFRGFKYQPGWPTKDVVVKPFIASPRSSNGSSSHGKYSFGTGTDRMKSTSEQSSQRYGVVDDGNPATVAPQPTHKTETVSIDHSWHQGRQFKNNREKDAHRGFNKLVPHTDSFKQTEGAKASVIPPTIEINQPPSSFMSDTHERFKFFSADDMQDRIPMSNHQSFVHGAPGIYRARHKHIKTGGILKADTAQSTPNLIRPDLDRPVKTKTISDRLSGYNVAKKHLTTKTSSLVHGGSVAANSERSKPGGYTPFTHKMVKTSNLPKEFFSAGLGAKDHNKGHGTSFSRKPMLSNDQRGPDQSTSAVSEPQQGSSSALKQIDHHKKNLKPAIKTASKTPNRKLDSHKKASKMHAFMGFQFPRSKIGAVPKKTSDLDLLPPKNPALSPRSRGISKVHPLQVGSTSALSRNAFSNTTPAAMTAQYLQAQKPTSGIVKGQRVEGKPDKGPTPQTSTNDTFLRNDIGNAPIVRLPKQPFRFEAIKFSDILGSASFSGIKTTTQSGSKTTNINHVSNTTAQAKEHPRAFGRGELRTKEANSSLHVDSPTSSMYFSDNVVRMVEDDMHSKGDVRGELGHFQSTRRDKWAVGIGDAREGTNGQDETQVPANGDDDVHKPRVMIESDSSVEMEEGSGSFNL